MLAAIASDAGLGACWRKLSSPPYIGAEWKVPELHSQMTKLRDADIAPVVSLASASLPNVLEKRCRVELAEMDRVCGEHLE
jgi:hypothetical protein